jgi:serine/threonine-protein kinase
MQIWSAEIKEIELLYNSVKGRFPELEKDLDHLIKTDDENVALLYSRRCLEIIVTDLCEIELKRPRKTEPLKGIIDKLQREEKVPSHIIVSMQFLNSLSTFGAHPKEFDTEQVRLVLINLATIIRWYLKHKETQDTVGQKKGEIPTESSVKSDLSKSAKNSWKKILLIVSGLFLTAVIIILVLIAFNIIGNKKQNEIPEKSIAVIPFINLSKDPEQEYFSNGMVDAILDHLVKLGDLKVISRTSSMRYKDTELPLKQIARELGVSSILEGSVQKSGNNVRITVQLIDAKTDSHLWSETYDKDLSDVFLIQSEVAQNVARQLKAALTSKGTGLFIETPLTTSQLAYDFYLKGKEYMSEYEPALAIDMYTKAIQEDSLFAAAYAQRAISHLYIFWTRFGEGWQGHDLKAREDIKIGSKINPELLEIRYAEAVTYYHKDRNYDKSLKILTELKSIVPKMAELYAYSSYIFRRLGRLEESVIELDKAIQLDPFNASYNDNLALTYQLLHQYDNQIEYSRKGLSVVPDYKAFNSYIFSANLDKSGDLEVAQKESGLKDEDLRYGINFFSDQKIPINQYGVYYYNRQYENLIESLRRDTITESDQVLYHPKKYEMALAYYLNGNKSLSKIYADSAIIYLKENINRNPTDERFWATLGKCYAFSGDIKEAVDCGQKAIELKPVKFDYFQGIAKEQDLMEIYIHTGNYDLALDKIEHLLSDPSWLSKGKLMIDPMFDKLRDLPRFQKIINSARK